MWKEFRAFIMRGNVIDLAVGVIIGAAFGRVVTSLVEDVIMPPIGLLVGRVTFSDIKLVLQPEAGDQAEVAINIGQFINVVIYFLIVAVAIFLLIRAIARLQKMTTVKEQEEEKKELPPTTEQLMLEELRAMRAELEKQNRPG